MSQRDQRLTPHEERVIAVRIGRDPRTIRSYLRGAGHSTAAALIEQALRDIGRADLIRPIGERRPA